MRRAVCDLHLGRAVKHFLNWTSLLDGPRQSVSSAVALARLRSSRSPIFSPSPQNRRPTPKGRRA